MTKMACQYKIVRFAPFAETEEFANVGVVLFEPKGGVLGFALARKNYARVNQFFDLSDDRSIFAGAIEGLEKELQRLQQELSLLEQQTGKGSAKTLFADFTRFQSGLIHFSETRVIRAQDLDATVQRLFNHYVERDFHNWRYREQVLVQELRETFKRYDLTRLYHEKQVETELYPVKIPLAYRDDGVLRGAIKPIAFDQKTMQAQVDHLDLWVNRARHLCRSGVNPDALMLAFDEQSAQSDLIKAYIWEKRRELEELDVNIADTADVDELVQFAHKRASLNH